MFNQKMKMPEEEFGIPLESQQKASNLGIVLGILIVILILLLVGLYYWGTELRKATEMPTIQNLRPTAEENKEPESTKAEAEVMNLGALSTSDTLDTIKADLDSTDVTNLDEGIVTIENEVNSAAE